MSNRAGQSQQPTAFVLMPFDDEFTAVFTQLVKPPLRSRGFNVIRADSFIDQRNILKDILKGIADSELVVADLTALRPNVLYEVGVAHALGKPTVLIAQSLDEIPFDLQSYRVLIYSTDFREIAKFKASLGQLARAVLDGTAEFGNPVTDFLGLQRSTPRRAPAPAILSPERGERVVASPAPEPGPEGLLDWVADVEDSLRNATESTIEMNAAMTDMGQRMSLRTAEMKQAAALGGPGTAARMRDVAAAAARDIDDFVERAGRYLPALRKSWDRFGASTVALLASPLARRRDQRESLGTFRESMRKLIPSFDTAIKGLVKLRRSSQKLKGMSKDLNQATSRLARLLDEIVGEMERAQALCTRILSLLDDVLGPET